MTSTPKTAFPPGSYARRATLVVAAVLAATTLLPSGASARSEELVTAPSGVTYVSGGVSTEAVDRLRAMEPEFNLKMVFALKSGEYVSDVKVEVVDATNKVVLDTSTEGPWLLAKLPAGNYQVNASYRRSVEHRAIAVGSGSLKTLDFRWAAE